jgi:integrase
MPEPKLPPGIRRHHGRYQVRYYATGREHAKSFELITDAKRFQREVVTDRDRGLWVNPNDGRMTVGEWAPKWLRGKVDLRASSRYRLDGIVRKHVLPAFGTAPLAAITNSAVREWVARMSSEVSAATTRKAFNALNQMLRAAVADRRIPFNPCADVPLPAEHAGEQRFLNADEIATLADCIAPRYRALVFLGAYGGLRFGELAGLRRGRVTCCGAV